MVILTPTMKDFEEARNIFGKNAEIEVIGKYGDAARNAQKYGDKEDVLFFETVRSFYLQPGEQFYVSGSWLYGACESLTKLDEIDNIPYEMLEELDWRGVEVPRIGVLCFTEGHDKGTPPRFLPEWELKASAGLQANRGDSTSKKEKRDPRLSVQDETLNFVAAVLPQVRAWVVVGC